MGLELGIPVWLSHAIDILVVAFIIYQIIIMIRGTRAVQMLAGLFLVALVYILAQVLRLVMLQWLIDNFLNYIVLIIIVLFQQDIRRALSEIGRSPFLSRAEAPRQEQIIEELVRAAVTLAARRIGAIIVIERESSLLGVVEVGVRLDALITRDLLVSIFNPASPLHDGAVIIQKGRIMAAGSFLPLSVNPDVPKELGSRHRAALGITEETDALAVVVSEETGDISLAVRGKLQKMEEAAILRELLLEELEVQVS